MPVQITVGPPVITINQGSTFMVTDQRGEIDSESEQGVFAGTLVSSASTSFTSTERTGSC